MWLKVFYNWLVGVNVSIASDIKILQRDVALLKLELHKTKEAQAKSLQEVRDSLLAKIGSLHGRLTNEIGSAIALIDQLRKEVFEELPMLGISIRVTNSEEVEGMADKFTFAVDLDPVEALKDVEFVKVAVTMDDDGVRQELTIPRGERSVDGFVGRQDTEGLIEIVTVDDATPPLESGIASQRFALLDQEAPQKVGMVTIRVTKQEEAEEITTEVPTERPGEQP